MLRFLIAVSLALSAAFGQEFRATLAGRVTDAAGAAVAGASIRVKNTGTGESAATTSGEDGSYQVSFLTPGDYVVTIEKAGFNRSIREGVHLDVAQRQFIRRLPGDLSRATFDRHSLRHVTFQRKRRRTQGEIKPAGSARQIQ